MDARRRNRSPGRRHRPVVEGLDGRVLLSLARVGPPSLRALQSEQLVLKRGTLASAMSGSYFVGPSRIEGQSLQTYFAGAGTANAFLHGNFQLAFATPSGPSESAKGIATLVPRNNFQTGNLLVLDLESDGPVDPNGRTAQFTWTVNDSSGGMFANAEGQGTLQIRYVPRGRGPRPAIENGQVATIFRGELSGPDTANLIRIP
jgi:hypothetical protein